MSDRIKEIIKVEKPYLLKYKKYVTENNWISLIWDGKGRFKNDVDIKKEEFDLQNSIIITIISRLKILIKKCEGSHHLKFFKDFVNDVTKVISIHVQRAEDYTFATNLTEIESTELRSIEIALHRHLHAEVSKIQDNFTALNIKTEENITDGIVWFDNQKATISMYKMIISQYPTVREKLNTMKIDLNSSPPATLHCLNIDPPKYDEEKNFWEQDPKVLQYYIWEWKKIDEGITIDSYYIDGWLYFHFNYFVTNIPKTVIKGGIAENEDDLVIPELRDNEILITDYFLKSKRDGKMNLIAATRRAAKTTLNSSRIVRAQILGKKQILCAGGSAEDLGHIHTNIETCMENINPAFKMYHLASTKDGRGKTYGIKTKANKSKVTTNVYIINLEGGTSKKKKETLAGFTPDEFILDEAMKFPFKKQLEALEPALWGAGVLRCNVLITGTGGDDELASDAISMLNDPIGNRITLMNWNDLERGVPEDLITWKRKDFGLFLPTQMCIKHVKIKSNLADYLGIDSEYLRQVPLHITDWKKAKESEDIERSNKISNRTSYVRLLAYHPFDPTEIFLSGRISPFPTAEAKAHKEHLIRTGLWDRRRMLYRDSQGRVQVELTSKELAPFPHKGGIIDAPFLILEDPPIEKVRYGTYTAGFDDYATDDSDTDSVSTFYIMKNKILGDPFSEKIVASISFRPEKHPVVYEKWLMLMEAYQLEGTCFGENFNYAIKDYLDKKHVSDKYLASSIDFTSTFNIPNNLKRKTGWNPTTCKKNLFELAVDYTNEEFEVEQDDGKIITLKGVQRIDDIGLLDEIIGWGENTNVDRLTAFMGANGMMHFLNSSHRWRVPTIEKMRQQREDKPKRERNFSMYSPLKRPSEQKKR